jgi:hypothetical protein
MMSRGRERKRDAGKGRAMPPHREVGECQFTVLIWLIFPGEKG